MIRQVSSVAEWRAMRAALPEPVGFVPTMGALHEGHLSLFRRCRDECATVVGSVFVNPTQFDDPGDLERYPRDLGRDLALLEPVGVDALLTPSVSQLYPDDYRYRVSEGELSRTLCGASRPGPFDGVLTVVMKLLNLIRPSRAYFGEKDYQQLLLVQGMARAFFMDVEVVGCPIVRDADGVALSSRNALLDREGRQAAAAFARILREGADAEAVRRALTREGIEVDYVEERMGRRFGAVRVGGVRLIDNVPA